MIAEYLKQLLLFIQGNWGMLPAALAVVAFVKEKGWLSGKDLTLLSLGLGIVFGASEAWLEFGTFEGLEMEVILGIILNGIALGGTASGLYKAGRYIAKTPQ